MVKNLVSGLFNDNIIPFNLFVWVDNFFYLCSRIMKKEEVMGTTITLLAMLDIRLRFVVGSVVCA